ncbi:hypothetical protein KIH86_04115, partial [Paenibacillus sp. HN-1]|uniref:hypothetical protein n=1 Tax=Paenibacillus sinensis TaxID=2834413 RepID=UPI001CA8B124
YGILPIWYHTRIVIYYPMIANDALESGIRYCIQFQGSATFFGFVNNKELASNTFDDFEI